MLYFSSAATAMNCPRPDLFTAIFLPTSSGTDVMPDLGSTRIDEVRMFALMNEVSLRPPPASIEARATVELPPKDRSALLPTTAWIDGAWLGNGPTQVTSMSWAARLLTNTPRFFAVGVTPFAEQTDR